MDIYQLNYLLHEPAEDHGWMYRAEVPALQGCVAWGAAPEETLKSLLAVAQTIIQVCKEDGQRIPPDLTPLPSSEGALTVTREMWLNPRNVGEPRQRAAGDHPQAQQS